MTVHTIDEFLAKRETEWLEQAILEDKELVQKLKESASSLSAPMTIDEFTRFLWTRPVSTDTRVAQSDLPANDDY